MKILHSVSTVAAMKSAHVVILELGPVCAACTQDLTTVPPPPVGNFYSMQHAEDNWPPFPFVPFDVPVYEWGQSNYLFDDRAVDYGQLQAEAGLLNAVEQSLNPPSPSSGALNGRLPGSDECASQLLVNSSSTNGALTIALTITNGADGMIYDLFRTFELLGDNATNSLWRWIGRGTNGQTLVLPRVGCLQAFYVLGCDVDTDNDGLTDAFEKLVSRTSPDTNMTFSGNLDDRDWWLQSNILVNDPDQDCGNEQNSQFETTCGVLGSNVIVAWVDSNRGIYGLGADSRLTNRTPRFVGYAVSRDGGVTFEDRGAPPLAREGAPANDDGDAGDPVLAVDRVSETVYLVGTSPRNAGKKGIPLWKSTDGGVTFTNPVIVLEGITNSDKPWIAVDDWPGTGQHDVYVMCTGTTNPATGNALWLAVSTDGSGGSWTNAPVAVREWNVTNPVSVNSPIIQIGLDHTADVFWFERTGVFPEVTNWLKMRQVADRGTTLRDVRTICQLATTHHINGNLELRRSNTAATNDFFNAWPFPVPAVNPTKTNHLYVAYADKGTNINDKADIYFVCSTNGGTNWTNPFRINTDSTTNDQWMPVMAVKPDGTQLFVGWYDRRNDTNNSLIEMYGRWAAIETNGSVTFGTEFKISTTNFPPVFAGADTNNIPDGHYDPVYPPESVNLHWHYDDWPTNASSVTALSYISHVGEYNGAFSEGADVYVTWTDYRMAATETLYERHQSDVRLVRIRWQ